MKNLRYIVFGFLIAFGSMGVFSSSLLAKNSTKDDAKKETSRLEALAKFTKVISIVEQYDVDKISIEELIDKSLKGLMSNLDAHSAYLSKKILKI